MRILSTISLGIGLAVLCGVPFTALAKARDDALLRFHFVGTRALRDQPETLKARTIAGLPETQALLRQTLQRLTQSTETWLGTKTVPEQANSTSSRLLNLLDDVMRREAFLAAHGEDPAGSEWTLAVSLPPHRMTAWKQALPELARAWGWGEINSEKQGDLEISITAPVDSKPRIRWTSRDGWLFVGWGPGALSVFEQLSVQLAEGKRPIPALGDRLLDLEADLGRLQKALELAPEWPWPRVSVAVENAGENLKTLMNLVFPEPVTGAVEPWHFPTNLVTEPLISFTAARGLAALTKKCRLFPTIGLEPAPDEIYWWAHSELSLQSYVAFPADGITQETLKGIPETLKSVLDLSALVPNNTEIEWRSATEEVFWKGLPITTPFLKIKPTSRGDFVFGGLFPPGRNPTPPPEGLTSQFLGRDDLIYYDWEITEMRLLQWRVIAQLLAVIADRAQIESKSAGMLWMLAVGKHLGNTGTEVTRVSPTEWQLVRRSHLGLTGIEIVALTRWLEGVHFPRPSFEMAPIAKRRQRPVPAQP